MLAIVKLAYLRISRTTPREPQEAALRTVGFTDFSEAGPSYMDEQPKRKGAPETREWRMRAIRACRQGEGDEVWVASPGVWASTPADAMAALEALTARGATLCIVSTGRRYRWHPDAAEVLSLAQEIGAENQRTATAAARASAAKRRAERTEDDADAWKQAKALWADYSVPVVAVAERTGLALRTLYRRFGARGNEPFTGKAKRKGRRK
jgi:hypothetical protein